MKLDATDQQEDAHFDVETSKIILSGFEENQSPDSCIENNEHLSYPIEVRNINYCYSLCLFISLALKF